MEVLEKGSNLIYESCKDVSKKCIIYSMNYCTMPILQCDNVSPRGEIIQSVRFWFGFKVQIEFF